jgi:hypothetical protein
MGLAVFGLSTIAVWGGWRLEAMMDERSIAALPSAPLAVGPLDIGERRRARRLHEVLLLLAGGPVELVVDGVIHIVEPGQEVVLPAGTPRQSLVLLRGAGATWLVSRTPASSDRARLAAGRPGSVW